MTQNRKSITLTLATGLLVMGGASRALGQVTSQTSLTPTLIVQINNVTDQDRGGKNSVELFVNDKQVLPSRVEDHGQHDYFYELPLASGIYKLKAIYRAKSFWKDEEFNLTTHDGNVRVHPGYVTMLTITLDKNRDGTLQQSKNFFTERPQPLLAEETRSSAAPVGSQVERNVPHSPEGSQTFAIPFVHQEQQNRSVTSTAQGVENPAQARLQSASEPETKGAGFARGGQITLQINTMPPNADVIVDDKFYGQSPVKISVNRFSNHVIQLSKPGHVEVMKIINWREFGNEKTYLLLQKLEAKH